VKIGQMISWLTLLMVLVTFVIVVLRYVFDTGLIWLQESLSWMHAVVFMIGAAYTLQQDDHVRVDIFYRKMTDRQRAWVNIAGVLLFRCALSLYTPLSSMSRQPGRFTKYPEIQADFRIRSFPSSSRFS
jgi:TRAP-type mannitol/chloroaromatic compound transport system permease small subunit